MSNRIKVQAVRFSHLAKPQIAPRGRTLAALTDRELLAWFTEHAEPGDDPAELLRVFRMINGREKEY